MPEYARRWTAVEVREFTDESRHWPRCELIDGELLVTPPPDLELEPDTVTQPDVFVVPSAYSRAWISYG